MFGFIILVSLFVVGCTINLSPNAGGENGAGGESGSSSEKPAIKGVDTIEKITVNSNYLSEVESFYDADNDYYMFTMGTVSNVPFETPVFFYYGGIGEIKHSFTKTVTSASSVSTTVKKVVENRLTCTIGGKNRRKSRTW